MYSVVLMAAMTAGSATPDCHRCGGCCGCYGGYGYGCGGCYGGCYGCFGGCYGGCWGGCGGCYGGCWGGCGGCYGGCYGCWGGYSSWGCMGCVGGVGYGGGISYPGAIMGGGTYAPGTVAPGGTAPGTAPLQGEGLPPAKSTTKEKETRLFNQNKAKLVVELPANAKLFIDDMPMKAEAGVRSFNTPTLEPGQAYYYMVRVETMKDGKPVSETRRIIVRAGQIARADFKDLDSDTIRTAQAK